MHPTTVSSEWASVAEAQQNKDAATQKAITLPIEEFRQLPYRAAPCPSYAPVPGEDISVTEEWVTVRDGTAVMVRVYRPLTTPNGGLLFLNAHGGGFVVGEPQSEEAQNRIITNETGSVTVSVDYRKAPEYRYPCAVLDCLDVLLWCKKHADMLDINPERIVLIGGSAGANIATVLALKCRDEHITGIVGHILNIPVICHPDVFPSSKYKLQSYERNANAPVLSATLMRWFWGKYLPNPSSDAYACPLLAKSLAGMPPTLLQIAGWDPLCDEGLAYAQHLEEAGVPTTLHSFDGLPHAFYIHPQLPSTKVFFNNMVQWVKENLQ